MQTLSAVQLKVGDLKIKQVLAALCFNICSGQQKISILKIGKKKE